MSLLLRAQRDLAGGNPLPIGRLLETRTGNFEHRHYAWSWALLQYLESNAATEGKLMDFLDRLRDSLPKEAKPGPMLEAARRAFLETYDVDLEQLDDDLARFLAEEVRLERPDQRLDFAAAAVERARGSGRRSDRRDLLDLARALLADLPEPQEAQAARERRLLSLEARIARARIAIDDGDLAAAWLVLRDLDAALRGHPDPRDAWRLARAANEALDVACAAAGVARRDEGPDETIPRLARGSDEGREALAGLAERVLDGAFEILASRLAEEPFHERSLRAWTVLAFRHRPARLREVFDRVLAQVERDPHDLNLATLALCYGGLGRESAARFHALAARRFSTHPAELEGYLALLGIEPPRERQSRRSRSRRR